MNSALDRVLLLQAILQGVCKDIYHPIHYIYLPQHQSCEHQPGTS